MKDSANPLDGWPLNEVLNTTSGAATADTYGKLFFYLSDLLFSFLNRVSSSSISFRLLHLDASFLPGSLDTDSFCRIDVSS